MKQYKNGTNNIKRSKYKYTYYQNTHTIVSTPTYNKTHIHTHTLQNPHIYTPTYYKTS